MTKIIFTLLIFLLSFIKDFFFSISFFTMYLQSTYFYHLKPHREIKFRTSIIHYASAISLVSLLTQKAYQFIESATYTSYKAELRRTKGYPFLETSVRVPIQSKK